MKNLLITIFLFTVVAGKAQFNWNANSNGANYNSTSSHSVTTDSASFTYDSDLMYVRLWKDSNGHTMHYSAQLKNIPQYFGAGKVGEFQMLVYDLSAGVVAERKIGFNYAPTGFEYDDYPDAEGRNYSGSFELSSEPNSVYDILFDTLFWEDTQAEYSSFMITPQIN